MLQAGLPHSPALVLHSTSLAQVVNPPHTPFKLKPLDEYYELRYWVRGGHEKNSRERWIIWPSLDFFRNRLGMGSTQNSKGLYSIRDLHYPPWKSWKSISFFPDLWGPGFFSHAGIYAKSRPVCVCKMMSKCLSAATVWCKVEMVIDGQKTPVCLIKLKEQKKEGGKWDDSTGHIQKASFACEWLCAERGE